MTSLDSLSLTPGPPCFSTVARKVITVTSDGKAIVETITSHVATSTVKVSTGVASHPVTSEPAG